MGKQQSDQRTLEGMATVFAALGSPTRFGLLVRLVERPYSVNDLADAAGAKQANVSQQLGILNQAGLVTSVRNGTTVTYSMNGPKITQIISLALHLLNGVVSRRCTSFGHANREV